MEECKLCRAEGGALEEEARRMGWNMAGARRRSLYLVTCGATKATKGGGGDMRKKRLR